MELMGPSALPQAGGDPPEMFVFTGSQDELRRNSPCLRIVDAGDLKGDLYRSIKIRGRFNSGQNI